MCKFSTVLNLKHALYTFDQYKIKYFLQNKINFFLKRKFEFLDKKY